MKLITKDSDNPFFRSKYAGLDAVMHEFKRSFAPNGLSMSQTFDRGLNPNVMSLVSTLMHTSGQWISGVQDITLVGTKVQDIMSASTYSRRYGMMAICGMVATDEDDDGNQASGRGEPEKKVFKDPKPAQKVEPKPAPKVEETGAVKEIIPVSFSKNTETGVFTVKTDKGELYITTKEFLAQECKMNSGKKVKIKMTVDKDMNNVILDVQPTVPF